jgi:DNA-binding transcriptional LysR family regulator
MSALTPEMAPDLLNPTLIRSFVALVESRSFQAAAERLGLAQPTVSLHIQRLEEQLGAPLLQRSRSGCEPTAQGQVLLPYAEGLLRLSEQAIRALQKAPLRLGASSNIGIYLLPPLLKRFLQQHPGTELTLTIDRNPVLATKLENREIDFALMEWWDGRPGFRAQPWRHEPMVVIVPPDHPLAARESLTTTELSGLALLGGEAGSGTGALLKQLFSAGSQPETSLQLGSTEAVKQAVKAGLGISLVMASAVEAEVAAGTLHAIPLGSLDIGKTLYVIWQECRPSHLPRPPLVDFLLR